MFKCEGMVNYMDEHENLEKIDDKEIDEIVDSNEEDDVVSDLETETFTYTVDNNNINNDYNKNDYSENKSYIYIIIGVLVLFSIIFLLVLFANKVGSKTVNFSDIEKKMVSGAKSYYEKNSDLLPSTDGSSVSVSTESLIQNSYLKPFSEMVSEGINCSGNVTVFKRSDDYSYFPYLNCGQDYESVKVSDKVIQSVVSSGDGLYKIDDEYVYRGEYPNNYVRFDGKEWRILRINSDGSIRLISTEKKVEKNVWDDRYNSEKQSYVGINDFGISRILDYLKSVYNNNSLVSASNRTLLVKNNWCIGKVPESDLLISNLDLCSEVYDDLYIGLINIDEVLIPSLASNCDSLYDIECTNYNYFFDINVGWTMNVSNDRSYIAFSSNGGSLSLKNASSTEYVRPVININGNVLYNGGAGTQDDPYLIGD